MFSPKFHAVILVLLLTGMVLPGCAVMDEWIAPSSTTLPGPDGIDGTPDDVITEGPSKLTQTIAVGQPVATVYGVGHFGMLLQGLSILLTQAYGIASVGRKEEDPDGETA